MVNLPMGISAGYYLAPPTGLQVFSSILEANGYNVEAIVDLALELVEKRLDAGPGLCQASAERLASFNADIYGFSIRCVNFSVAIDIARRLYSLKPCCRIVFGGHHAATVGKRLTERFPFIHYVVDGPGEKEFNKTGRIEYHWDISSKAESPEFKRYLNVSFQPTGVIEVARGCPFSCSFCSIPVIFGPQLSYKPVEKVICQVASLLHQGCKEIHFVADNFTIEKRYVHELLNAIQAHSFDISWTIMTRIDLVTPQLLQEMKIAGCYSILYGVESADAETLEAIGKRTHRCVDLVEFLMWNKKAGISASMQFIVNLPADSLEGLKNSLYLAARLSILDPGVCDFKLPRFVPGTKLTRQCIDTLIFDDKTPYASTLHQMIGDVRHEAWELIKDNPDIFSTYYSTPGPISRDAANALAWIGDYLFEIYPLTLAILAEKDSLIEVFEYLGAVYSGRYWHQLARGELINTVNNFIEGRKDRDLLEVFKFESWFRGYDDDSRYCFSRVDLKRAHNAALKNTSLKDNLFGLQRIYVKNQERR